MDWDAFFTVHRDLPREGPGLPEDVHWVLAQRPAPACVLDAACGPGADTVTLAEALPQARIDAVEQVPHFVAAAQARTTRFGTRVSVQSGDMMAAKGPYDLIWCAGAVYFVGVTAALSGWRRALAPGGAIAFSEPMVPEDASPTVRRFWEGEGVFSDEAGILQQVRSAGYRVCATRRIVGAAWEAYYQPMQARIAALRAKGVNAAVEAACREAESEIANWRAAPDEIAYLLLLVEPLE